MAQQVDPQKMLMLATALVKAGVPVSEAYKITGLIPDAGAPESEQDIFDFHMRFSQQVDSDPDSSNYRKQIARDVFDGVPMWKIEERIKKAQKDGLIDKNDKITDWFADAVKLENEFVGYTKATKANKDNSVAAKYGINVKPGDDFSDQQILDMNPGVAQKLADHARANRKATPVATPVANAKETAADTLGARSDAAKATTATALKNLIAAGIDPTARAQAKSAWQAAKKVSDGFDKELKKFDKELKKNKDHLKALEKAAAPGVWTAKRDVAKWTQGVSDRQYRYDAALKNFQNDPTKDFNLIALRRFKGELDVYKARNDPKKTAAQGVVDANQAQFSPVAAATPAASTPSPVRSGGVDTMTHLVTQRLRRNAAAQGDDPFTRAVIQFALSNAGVEGKLKRP